jgi:hypothetical protein
MMPKPPETPPAPSPESRPGPAAGPTAGSDLQGLAAPGPAPGSFGLDHGALSALEGEGLSLPAWADHAASLAFSMRLPGWPEAPEPGALVSLAATVALRLSLGSGGGIGFDTSGLLDDEPPAAAGSGEPAPRPGPAGERFWFG